MPEIVGTAYVRIRAITTALGSDIQDGLEKGAKDAKVDRAGQKIGTDLSSSIGDGLDKGMPDVVDGIDSHIEKGGGTKIEKRGNWLGRKLMQGFGDGVDKDSSFEKKVGSKLKSLEGLADKLSLPGIAWKGLLGLGLLNQVVATAGAILGTLVAQIGYIATAAGGAGAAIGSMAALAALAAIPITLAFKADTPALKEFQEFAKGVSQEWAAVGKATQKYLLPGLTSAVKMTRKLIPIFKIFGEQVGRTVGNFAKFTVGLLTASRNAGPWAKVLMFSSDILLQLSSAVAVVAEGLLLFLANAGPIADQFAHSLGTMATNFNEFMRAGDATGTLATTLQIWYDRAELIGTSLANLTKVIGNVFKIGADSASPFFDVLLNTTNKWLEFTQSVDGAAKIRKIFDDMRPVMQEVSGLITDIVKWILTPALTGDTGGMLSFLRIIRNDLLPVIEDLADSLSGTVTENLITFTTELAKLVKVGAESGALQSFFGTFTNAIKILTTLLDIPGIGQFVSLILTLAGSFKAFMIVAAPFVTVLGPIVAAIAEIAFGTSSISALMAGVGVIFAEAGGGIAGVATAIGALLGPIAIFIGIIAGLIAAVVAVTWAFKNWDKITEWVSKAWTAVVNFVKDLPGMIADAATFLWDWIPAAIPIALKWLGDFGRSIFDFLWNLPQMLVDAIGSAGSALWGWIQEAIPIAGRFLAQLIETVGEFLIKLPFRILEWLGNAAVSLFSWIVDAIPFVLTHLDDWAIAIGGFLLGIPALIIKWLAVAAGALWSWIVDSGPEVISKLIEWANDIGNWLLSLPGKVLGWLSEAGSGLWKWIVDTAPIVLEKLGYLLGFIIGWVTSLPGKIGERIGPAASALWEWIQKVGPILLTKLGAFALTIGNFLLTLPGKILGWLAGAISALWSWIVDAVPGLIEKLGYFLGFLAGFLASLPFKIGEWLAGAISALWGWIVDAVPVVLEKLNDFATAAISWVLDFIGKLPGYFLGAIEALWGWIVEAVPKLLSALGDFAGKVWNWITDFVSSLPGRIASAAIAMYNWISDAAAKLPGQLADFAQDIWTWVTNFLAELPGKFTAGVSKMLDIGKDIVEGVWNGIKNAKDWILDKIKGFAGSVIDGFKDGFGISSPAKKMMPVGMFIAEGLQIGIEKATGLVQRATDKLAEAATPNLSQLKTNYSVNVNSSSTGLASLTAQNARTAGSNLSTAPAVAAAATVAAAAAAVAAQEVSLSLIVKIGDRDITDIIETVVSDNDFSTAQTIYRTTKG